MLRTSRFLVRLLALAGAFGSLAYAVTVPTSKKKKAVAARHSTKRIPVRHTALAVASKASPGTAASAPKPAAKPTGHWRAPNYADSTAGDIAMGENPIAR